ncbi:hypothetical protein C2E25_02745 [Geothermobacter hydrogeniphilus]|uniref:YhdP central domain-containing protein n=1 Tax=Geothermobacter hydrogeniphilus TaxID=1969733 RepID=A0A2K2HD62_9BACT|nr:AsmA-like C-terminal domain-containing protein [Geothermobacter hydrogeniphilus]PNU21235.1 hypothetical protein C2E25_02745 [Geothermobacter hydrogeniphilus]
MPRSRSIARLIVLLLLLTCAAGALVLVNINLNSYRTEIATGLGELLGRPVSFGRIGYSLRNGLAVDCRDLEIPASADSNFSLKAAHLYLKVDILPLLRGELVLRQLILDHPRLQIDLSRPRAPNRPSQNSSSRSMTTSLRKVRMQSGTISVRLPETAAVKTLRLRDIDLRVENRPGQRLGISLQGITELDSNASELALTGEIASPWRGKTAHNRIDLDLQLKHLPLDAVARRLGMKKLRLTGKAFLSARLRGSAVGGIAIQSTLTAAQARYTIGDRPTRPVGQWQLAATWQRDDPATDRLRNITLKHNDLRLDGKIELRRQVLSAHFQLPRTSLHSWLELAPEPLLPAGLLEQTEKGRISATIALPPTPLAQLTGNDLLDKLRIDADFDQLSWKFSGLPPLEQGRAQLQLIDGRIIAKTFQARWAGRLQTLTGSITLDTLPRFALQGTLQPPPLQQLRSLLPDNKQTALILQGAVPLRWSCRGRPENLTIGLDGDLTTLRLDYPGWFSKKPGEAGRLRATLSKKGDSWDLADSRLDLAGESLTAEGFWRSDSDWKLRLRGTRLDLQQLLKRSRHLAPHRPRGTLDLDLKLRSAAGPVPAVNGRLQLHDVGVHLTRSLADLQRINGTLLMTGQGMKTVLLNARLGQSPVTLQLQLNDFTRPELQLHLQARSVGAHELIFPSRKQKLRDLDGRITIAARGIDFDLVKVRLDGGTDCVVTGTMQGWHRPHIALQIDAAYADIDEVIALWKHPGKPKQAPATKPVTAPPPEPTISIKARVATGKLSRLRFINATGTITGDGRGLLSIAPLQFYSGEGFGSGQVIVKTGPDHTSRLIVSGHVENFPAQGIHRDLLQRDSILTGTLRGDFYLEGLTGDDFIRTSRGGINLEIDDGVLKRFKVLSKLFSLLNVSQLFSLHLPDMAEEGMPFKKIDATFSLAGGLLKTEDLLVHSEAMDLSMVGEYDLNDNRIDAVLGIKPLKTVDKIITKIPIAGWILTGKEKALITAHFTVKGSADQPEVVPVPITSLSNKVFGIFKRVLTLPGKVITDPGDVILPQSVNPKE